MTAVVDHTRIERILRNLVVNATEHGEGKPIDINVVGDDRPWLCGCVTTALA